MKISNNKDYNNITNTFQENLFLNSLKLYTIKTKCKQTNYEFFTYNTTNYLHDFSQNEHLSNFNNKLYGDNRNDEENIKNENFLLTSFYCSNTSTTKILMENIKLDELSISYNYQKEKYSYFDGFESQKDNEINNYNIENHINSNLIFDISVLDRKKRNLSKIRIIENFLIIICEEEILFFFLSDIMLLNKNLYFYSFKFKENFTQENNLSFVTRNMKNIPQAYNWPVIETLNPRIFSNDLKINKVEKNFIFLFYNGNEKNNYFSYI